MIDYAVRAYSNTTIEQGLVTDMEEGYHEEISRIRALLFENPVGMSIKDIATALSLNRNTVTRYLDLLQVQGSVDARRIGTSRVYALSQRVPAAPLLTCTPGPAVLIDQNLAVTTLNEQFQKTFSLTTSDWTGRSASDLPFLTQDQAGEVSAFRVAIRSALRGTPGTMVVRGPPHGISDTSLSLLPVVFENGKPGVAILLTGAGTKEGYTTKSPTLEEQYLALTKDQAEAVCRFTPDGTITFANPRASDILGLPLEDMVGQTFRLIVQGEDHDRFEATLAALSPVKPQGTVETRLILSSGDVGWLRWRLRALFGGNGQVVEYQAMGLDITEYKRALERLKRYHETLEDLVEARTLDLRESNQQLMQEIARRERLERELLLAKFATDAAGEMIIWLDEDQRFLYANKAALFTLGYAWSELGRMKIGEVTPGGPFGNGAKEVRSLISTVAEGEVGTFVGDLVIRDGGTIPVEMTLNRIQFRNRDLTCCFARDITARRFAEDTQRESEEKFRTLAEETEVGIFILNGDALTYINPAFTRITGFFIEELGIRGFYSLIHPDFSGIVEPEIRSSLATQGCMVKRTFKIVRSDAKERWVSFTGTKIVLRGRPAFLGTFLDITEERMREEEVRNLAAIVSSSEDAIFSKNMEGTVQTWNIGAEKVYGYSAGEIIGKHVALLLPPGSSDDLNEILKKVRLGEKIDHYETRRRRKDGTVIDVSITVSPVSTIGGVITGASIIGRDITERKRYERAMREGSRKLQLLGSLVRHDVLNRVNALLGYLVQVEHHTDEEEAREFIGKAKQIVTAIQKDLEFTRTYKDLGILSPTWQNVGVLIHQGRSALTDQRLFLEVDIPRDLEVFADPLFERVITILYENTLRHGVCANRASFFVRNHERDLVLTYTDNGVGVLGDRKEEIFDPGVGENTGFGLFLAREILSITDITIQENGVPDAGARFEITAPDGLFRYKPYSVH